MRAHDGETDWYQIPIHTCRRSCTIMNEYTEAILGLQSRDSVVYCKRMDTIRRREYFCVECGGGVRGKERLRLSFLLGGPDVVVVIG